MQSVLGREPGSGREGLQVGEEEVVGGLDGRMEAGVSARHGKLRSGGNNLDC